MQLQSHADLVEKAVLETIAEGKVCGWLIWYITVLKYSPGMKTPQINDMIG